MLFATTRGAGHVGPLVPFAHACVRAGHDVAVRRRRPPPRRSCAGPGFSHLVVGEPPDRAAAWAPVFSRDEAPGRRPT